jgi:glycosyltransferase involved in cell wall biosynthesis
MAEASDTFFFGPLPPPTHGMAVVNAQMVGLLGRYGDVYVGDISPGGLQRGVPYHVRKAARVLRALMRLPAARLSGCVRLYGSPDEGWGGIWTAMLVLAGRVCGMQVTLHHHSYRYLLRPTLLMKVIAAFAGTSARHVVLGEDMAEKLSALYPGAQNVVICENTVAAPSRPLVASERPQIVVGILANLSADKGALAFLQSVMAMLDAGMNIRAILAGPVSDRNVETAIDEACRKYGNKIVAIGAVHGDAKEKFFEDIDLFLFPTQYRTEAFPLVLMESLVRGVPVLAYRRGCIGALDGQAGVELVDVGSDFIAPAIATARRLNTTYATRRAEIAAAACVRNAANLAGLKALAAEICGRKDSRA